MGWNFLASLLRFRRVPVAHLHAIGGETRIARRPVEIGGGSPGLFGGRQAFRASGEEGGDQHEEDGGDDLGREGRVEKEKEMKKMRRRSTTSMQLKD